MVKFKDLKVGDRFYYYVENWNGTKVKNSVENIKTKSINPYANVIFVQDDTVVLHGMDNETDCEPCGNIFG